MHKPEICLFRHPTTTVFVDDNDDFLYSIALGVDRLPYRSFSSPVQGLAYVNQFSRSYDSQADDPPGSGPGLSKLFRHAGNKVQDSRRFAEPSVLVVDHSMPGITGLDLCAQISNPNVKKVLLTGVADEGLAIEALNIELIDFYISKREDHLAQRLKGIISHLETRYFQDLYAWSRDNDVRRLLPQLFDTAFADYFEDLLESLDIVEYYPLVNNSGFRLISGYGQCKRLVVFSEAQLDAFLQATDSSTLSPAIRQKLEQRELIPSCISPSDFSPLAENQLLSPTLVEGKGRWYCALYNDASLQQAINYQQFLKTPQAFDEWVYADS